MTAKTRITNVDDIVIEMRIEMPLRAWRLVEEALSGSGEAWHGVSDLFFMIRHEIQRIEKENLAIVREQDDALIR
jgi:hypothetical protein